MKAILLVSHGSRLPKTKEEVIHLLERIRRVAKADIFEYAFLEIESPSIPEGIERCLTQGATEVVLLMNFLNSGKHVDQDIPALIEHAKIQHPTIQFKMTAPVGQHPEIINLFSQMIE